MGGGRNWRVEECSFLADELPSLSPQRLSCLSREASQLPPRDRSDMQCEVPSCQAEIVTPQVQVGGTGELMGKQVATHALAKLMALPHRPVLRPPHDR